MVLMPITLDDIKNSKRPIVATCKGCGRVAVIQPRGLRRPGDTDVIEIGRLLRCTGCGHLGATAYPQTTRCLRQGRDR